MVARCFSIALLLLACTGFGFASDQSKDVEPWLRALQETPNWQVFTVDFLAKVKAREKELVGTPVTVLGTVVDAEKRPVQGALVLLRIQSNRSNVLRINGVAEDVFAITLTDRQGVFRFKSQPTPYREPVSNADWQLQVYAPGSAVATRNYAKFDGRARLERITLQPENVIRGFVVDSQGAPVTAAKVALTEVIRCTAEDGRGRPEVVVENSLLFSELEHHIPVGADGGFSLGGLPNDRVAAVSVRTPGWMKTGLQRFYRIATTASLKNTRMVAKDHPRARSVYPLLDPDCVIQSSVSIQDFEPQPTVQLRVNQEGPIATIRVIDDQTGEGVSAIGTSVLLGKAGDDPRIYLLPKAVTDAQGIARIRLPPEACHVVVHGRRFGYATHFETLSTDPNEYEPELPIEQWVKDIPAGQDSLEIEFRLQKVSPLKVTVEDDRGKPVSAQVTVSAPDWDYEFAPVQSNENGVAEISIRPVLFDVKVVATTADGLRGEVSKSLSKDLNVDDTLTIIVRPQR